MTASSPYQHVAYLKSALEKKDLPSDVGAEIAFIGRSNAGKSSALNALTGIKGLARTSKTPGRTQMLHFFSLTDEHRLVDLPGYGYAQVPLPVKERWAKKVDEYLRSRHCLVGLVVVMDIRHPLKEMDQQMIEWSALTCQTPTHILLTKADKLSRSAMKKTLMSVEQTVGEWSPLITVQTFSSVNGHGLGEFRHTLDHWFEFADEQASS